MLGMLHGFLKEAAEQQGCERSTRAAAASRCGPAELKWGELSALPSLALCGHPCPAPGSSAACSGQRKGDGKCWSCLYRGRKWSSGVRWLGEGQPHVSGAVGWCRWLFPPPYGDQGIQLGQKPTKTGPACLFAVCGNEDVDFALRRKN